MDEIKNTPLIDKEGSWLVRLWIEVINGIDYYGTGFGLAVVLTFILWPTGWMISWITLSGATVLLVGSIIAIRKLLRSNTGKAGLGYTFSFFVICLIFYLWQYG